MSEKREMSELLKHLAGEGRLESEGDFTLSLKEAGRKLGLLQLPEPRAYILKLVQWAVCSRPNIIQVEIRGKTVRVWHDGEAPDLAQFSQLESLLIADGALGHLGIGLNSALSFEPTSIRLEQGHSFLSLHPTLETGDLQRPFRDYGCSLVLEGIGRRLFEPSPLVRQTAARYWDILPRTFTLTPDASGFIRPECALVRQRCLKGSIPIVLNGRNILRPINSTPSEGINFVRTDSGGKKQRVRHLLSRTVTPGAIPCPNRPLGHQQTDWLAPEPGQLTATPLTNDELVNWPTLESMTFEGVRARPGYANYYHHTADSPGTISWLKDGIIVDETPLTGCVYVVADASDLKTDLSQFSLVADEAYLARRAWIEHWIPR